MMPEGNFSEILVAAIIKDLQSALEELQAIFGNLPRHLEHKKELMECNRDFAVSFERSEIE